MNKKRNFLTATRPEGPRKRCYRDVSALKGGFAVFYVLYAKRIGAYYHDFHVEPRDALLQRRMFYGCLGKMSVILNTPLQLGLNDILF